MITKSFAVTYQIVTPESAEGGDLEEIGFVGARLTLREAFDAVTRTRTSEVGGVECVEDHTWPALSPAWVTVVNGCEFRTGAQESRSLHIPNGATAATRRRIARLLGVNV